ncbi:MAG: hypothetical protein JWR10_858 [Rubritepida sp.]|nr:hypothetical protein [Rubritepida sp.]
MNFDQNDLIRRPYFTIAPASICTGTYEFS